MINLRYHVVSLVAVFLALGMGIVMGSTVIDRVTVDALNSRLEDVRRSVNGIRDENRRLVGQVQAGRDFADQSRDLIVRDRLSAVPVMIVAVRGVDREPVEALRELLVESGATLAGTVWVLPRLRLESEADVRELAAALGLPPVNADTMRRLALARLVGESPGERGAPGATVAALVEAGFVTFDPPPPVTAGSTTTVVTAPGSTTTTAGPGPSGPGPLGVTRHVIVSGAGAEVSDDLLAVPLAQALAATSGRGVAVESGADEPGGRAVFVGLLRGDGNVSSRISTVDNLETSMGQVATVMAVADLVDSRVGHFGTGPGAQRLIPGDDT